MVRRANKYSVEEAAQETVALPTQTHTYMYCGAKTHSGHVWCTGRTHKPDGLRRGLLEDGGAITRTGPHRVQPNQLVRVDPNAPAAATPANSADATSATIVTKRRAIITSVCGLFRRRGAHSVRVVILTCNSSFLEQKLAFSGQV